MRSDAATVDDYLAALPADRRDAWLNSGERLNMGKNCVRFKNIEDIALGVVDKAVKRVPVAKFIKHYETAIRSRR